MIGIIGGSGVYEITEKADSCTEKVVETEEYFFVYFQFYMLHIQSLN